MSSTESKMMWSAIVLSLLLVLALGTLAVYSVLGQDDDDAAADIEDDDENDADADDEQSPGPDDGTPAAPSRVAGDPTPTVDAGCARASDPNRGYAVTITNEGFDTVDYVVSIELVVSGARPLVTAVDVPNLGPGERREVAVDAASPGGSQITGCSIVAIQSDRRVLLANS